jgi:hypothetical protein
VLYFLQITVLFYIGAFRYVCIYAGNKLFSFPVNITLVKYNIVKVLDEEQHITPPLCRRRHHHHHHHHNYTLNHK